MMNLKNFLVSGLMVSLLILISGCGTSPSRSDLAATIAVNVAAVQTVAAASTNAAMTEIAKTPTVTPTLEPSSTISLTPTSDKLMLTLSKDTYCRTGAQSSFPSVTLLLAGQTVEVIAQNPSKDSYYVEEPQNSFSRCWVWGKYATLNGDQTILPVYTSIPTATPTFTPRPQSGFAVSYIGMETCAGEYYFRFFIKNTGSFTWESLSINLYDNTSKISTAHFNTSFMDYSACAAGLSQLDLATGEESYVAAYNTGQFGYDPTGHDLSATFSLCRKDTYEGCDPKTITFIP